MNFKLNTALALLAMGMSLTFFTACNKGPSISVGGSTLSESDLKSQRPKEYAALKKEFDDKVLERLQNLATQKLIDLEAKDQGVEPDVYMAGIRAKTPAPDEAAMRQMFDGANKAGRLPPGATFESMKESISNFMRQQAAQESVGQEIARLKKKYNYTVNREIIRQDVDIAGEPVRLNPAGQITVVEFSDFDCFYCKKFQATGKQLREKYGDKLKWVVKDFPLTSIHPEAMGAHIAANCVYKQAPEKYWPIFDAIVSQDRPKDLLKPAQLKKLALAQGIDAGKFDECVADPASQKEVEQDMEEGQQVGVNGTPAFFINGRFINGAVPYATFEEIVEAELAN